jgi:dihydroorotase
MKTLLIKRGTLVRSDGLEEADLLLHDNVIVEIGSIDIKTDETMDASGKLIFPGFIDCHVHFREPGYEEKATMKTEATSAQAGGVLTVCEMPNTNPPTVTVAALADKVRRASEIRDIDLRFFFGITKEEHLLGLRELFTSSSEEMQRLRKRCCGVKVYFDHSTGNQKIEEGLLPAVFEACAELGITLVGHCEDAGTIAGSVQRVADSKETSVATHSERRPPEAEAKAIQHAIDLAKKYKTHFHVAHLSTKQGIDLVRAAKKEGVTITCEVAPHHLFLTVDDYKKLGTLGKMNPPLRTKDHQEALWKGIHDGTVDCIATDHAPHTLAEKQAGDPLKALSGVPGVETMIPLLLKKLSPIDLYRLCFENPNRIFHLEKNPIEVGTSSIVIIDPNVEWTIHAKDLHSKCGWTPFEGMKVKGRVMKVIN